MGDKTKLEKTLERKIILLVWVSVLVIFGISLLIFHITQPVTIHFIDIGQGDSCLIKAGDGGTVLIDGGDAGSGQSLKSFFSVQNVNKLDAVFVSHFHDDHVLGIIELLESNFPISHIYFSEHLSKSENEKKLLRLTKKNKIPITRLKEDDTLTLGKASYMVIYQEPYESEDSFNNMSMILRMDCWDSSILFTGDMEKSGAERLLSQNTKMLDVDVLKVPHHGGASSASLGLFQAASPEYSVISLALNNPYGNPAPETLAYLLEVNSEIYRTDRDGTVSMTLGKKGIKNISYSK